MPSPYDYYLEQPASGGVNLGVSRGPQMYLPSDSMWGNNRGNFTRAGLLYGSGGAAIPAVAAESMYQGLTGAGSRGLRQGDFSPQSLGSPFRVGGNTFANALTAGMWENGGFDFGKVGLGDLKKGNILGIRDFAEGGWRNAASFGGFGRSRDRENARNAYLTALAQWRDKIRGNVTNQLNQYGEDVRGAFAEDLDSISKLDPNKAENFGTTLEQKVQQYLLNRNRASQARKVDSWMSDPGRLQDRNRQLRAGYENEMGSLADQTQALNRNNAFVQSRRGMLGSSVDAEQRGDIAANRDRAASSIQQGVEQRAQQYRLGDQQQREALLGLIYANDPQTAQLMSQRLASIQQTQQNLSEQQIAARQQSQARTAASQGYGSAVSGLLSSAAQPLEYYLSTAGGGA